MDKNLQQQLYGGIPRSPYSSSGGTRQSSVGSVRNKTGAAGALKKHAGGSG